MVESETTDNPNAIVVKCAITKPVAETLNKLLRHFSKNTD